MIKPIILLSIFSSLLFAQSISFSNDKSLSLKDLKENYQVHKIEVWNYQTRSFEKYKAFSFKKILNNIYGDQWKNSEFIKVKTKDQYYPFIEIYKFKERKPYIAFKRIDSHSFSSIFGYKDEIVDLSPFFLIWEEDYKGKAARRRDHWPYKITGFELEKYPPVSIIPEPGVDEDIMWGYKNYLKQCLNCHQINSIGGLKGGDIFTNKVFKQTDKEIARYILNPKSVNPKSNMSPFALKIDMRGERVKNIIKYMRYISKRNFKKFTNEDVKRSIEYKSLLEKIDSLP